MPGIGPTLRDARIRARIDIAEVESRTKIRAKYLRAIENEEWELLPGPVYIRSFLRTYGDYLGLDSRMLVEEFKRRHEQLAEHELHPLAPLRRERDPDRGPGPRLRLPPWLAIVGVLIAAVVALYVIGNANNGKTPQTPSARAGKTHRHKHRHHAKPKPAPPPKPKLVTLQLVPTAAVYVCLENGARKPLIPGVVYNVGQTIPTETAREFLITLGNANVQMKLNGKPVTVPASTAAIGLRILPQGVSPLPPGSQPTCP